MIARALLEVLSGMEEEEEEEEEEDFWLHNVFLPSFDEKRKEKNPSLPLLSVLSFKTFGGDRAGVRGEGRERARFLQGDPSYIRGTGWFLMPASE